MFRQPASPLTPAVATALSTRRREGPDRDGSRLGEGVSGGDCVGVLISNHLPDGMLTAGRTHASVQWSESMYPER